MKKNIIFIITFLSSSLIFGQNMSTVNQAIIKYEEGNFNEALSIANTCIGARVDPLVQVEALRVISQTYLALDEDSAAISAAIKIIELNPKIEPRYLTDPPKFIKIINNLKQVLQQNTTETISKKIENINKAPATAIMFKSTDLKKRGYLDFEAVLHDLPGFDISRSNGNLYTHVYQRGYRSINTNRTLFLIDGVEDNDLWSSNVYLSRQFIMSNVKSLDVVYGPASTIYGSNAFLGVLNIVTKDPSDIITGNNVFGSDFRVGYGSYNTKFIDGTIALQTKDRNVGFMLSGRTFLSNEQNLSNYYDHDYQPAQLTDDMYQSYRNALNITDSATIQEFLSTYSSSDLFETDSAGNVVLTNTGVKTAFNYDNELLNKVTFADKTKTFSVNAKLKIYDFTLGFYYWQKSEGPGSQYNDIAYLTYNEGMSWSPIHYFLYVKYEKDINNKLNFVNFLRFKTHTMSRNNSIALYGDSYLGGDFNLFNLVDGVVPSATRIFLFYKANQLRNETKIFYHPGNRFDLVAGVETRFSSNQGDYFVAFENNAQQLGTISVDVAGGNQFFSTDIGAYVQGTVNILPQLNVLLGGRYDFNRVRTTEGYGSVFNERVALVYSPGTLILKGIFATAFKDATNREKYSTAPGKRDLTNPFLEPEKVKNIEFSVAKHFNKDNPNNITKIINFSFYYSMYSNIIQEVQVLQADGSYTNQNQATGKAEIYGINAFSQFDIANFSFYGNYTYTQPFIIDPENSDGTPQADSLGNPIEKLRISDIANHRANFGFNYNLNNTLNFNFRTNFVGQRITGTHTTVPTNTSKFSPYVILNSTVGYTPNNSGITIQFTGFNILNTEYFEPGLDAATGALSPMLAQNRFNFYLSIYYNF
ncbi:MAG: TonB-dependent receptor [Bacteroidales bacterium]|nr:TonB-dependent receptor [Bacteroidales bacterium]